ncbi:PQQ-binding-like beta-propeller repeat protein [Bacteroides sp.]|uniref:outer membrane protein assembly factor BamB family protein n=1 Tax=Bacteroides sp. TaxID=29523 RepID=UPI002621E1F7|nr:PQQ-binding-like beta-propeller repeat protein [Bacteroides sp.]
MKRIIYLLIAAVGLLVGCNPAEEAWVQAGFTTDKESYEIGDLITLTNTSTAENAQIAVCKWEFMGKVSYELAAPEPFSVEEGGDYLFRLTVTSDHGSMKSVFEKTIKIIDDGIRPTADFSWLPEQIVAGEEVVFTDQSKAAEGCEIIKREWTFGAILSTGENPTVTFGSHGKINVSLTVTDNKKRKDTKTVTVDVAKSAGSLGVLWAHSYDEQGVVVGTSPATSADGEYVYVSSSNYNLVCFTKLGERVWGFDCGQNNEPNRGSDYQHPTPTVDSDGVVYVAVGDNTSKADAAKSASLYAVKGGADGGTQKWFTSIGAKSSMRPFGAPVVTDRYVMILTNSAPSTDGMHFRIYDKTSGVLQYAEKTSSGSYGGCVGLKDGRVLVNTGQSGGRSYGTHIFFPKGNSWSKSTNEQNYAPNDQPNGSQIAVGADGKAYILCLNLGARISTNETKALVYCYDTKKTTEGNVSAPEWYTAVKGENKQTGYGLVVDGNGVVYVATDKYITAISSTGSVLWATEVAGTAYGVPAIDNEGYIYYNDTEKGSLVKLEPATGKAIASLQLGTGLQSSPTISADGIIYVTGMLEGKPTLFAVEGAATGYAANAWSQMGGNPGKSGYMY